LKTSAHQIAERYVRALFEVATDDAARAQVEKDLAVLGAFFSDKSLAKVILNPLLTRAQQASAMKAVLDKIKAHKITAQFVALLAARKRLSILPEISDIFSELAATSRGELKARITSTATLAAKDIESLSTRLSKAYGKKVMLETHQDAGLLGGLIIKIGSVQLDASLAGKLNRLSLALKAA
jgi:F-type H+-transporting ATPase subunit delta